MTCETDALQSQLKPVLDAGDDLDLLEPEDLRDEAVQLGLRRIVSDDTQPQCQRDKAERLLLQANGAQ